MNIHDFNKMVDEAAGFVQKLDYQLKKTKVQGTEKKMKSKGNPAKEAGFDITVGDIFYYSWGYDQTNIDWFKVVAITPTGKSAKFQPIEAKVKSDGQLAMQGKTVPDPKKKKRGEKVITKRLKTYGNDTIADMPHGILKPWDGKPKHVSWYA